MSPSLLKREQTQEELRKAFEKELQNGKRRLRQIQPPPTGGVQVMPTGNGRPDLPPKPRQQGQEEVQTMSGHSQPPPPPVMPVGKIITSTGQIPEAPRLPKQFSVNADVHLRPQTRGSRQVSKTVPEMSPREALLSAIRDKGGVKGLRKVG